jgi:hypothetical protein
MELSCFPVNQLPTHNSMKKEEIFLFPLILFCSDLAPTMSRTLPNSSVLSSINKNNLEKKRRTGAVITQQVNLTHFRRFKDFKLTFHREEKFLVTMKFRSLHFLPEIL